MLIKFNWLFCFVIILYYIVTYLMKYLLKKIKIKHTYMINTEIPCVHILWALIISYFISAQWIMFSTNHSCKNIYEKCIASYQHNRIPNKNYYRWLKHLYRIYLLIMKSESQYIFLILNFKIVYQIVFTFNHR